MTRSCEAARRRSDGPLRWVCQPAMNSSQAEDRSAVVSTDTLPCRGVSAIGARIPRNSWYSRSRGTKARRRSPRWGGVGCGLPTLRERPGLEPAQSLGGGRSRPPRACRRPVGQLLGSRYARTAYDDPSTLTPLGTIADAVQQ
jgi:hypothetical protein